MKSKQIDSLFDVRSATNGIQNPHMAVSLTSKFVVWGHPIEITNSYSCLDGGLFPVSEKWSMSKPHSQQQIRFRFDEPRMGDMMIKAGLPWGDYLLA